MDIRSNTMQALLGKPAAEFTLADITGFMKENGIGMVNFMYPAADGRLKTLNFVITNEQYLHPILTSGERVVGLSFFPFIDAGRRHL